ncbi:hypothetical protein NUW54_g9001 [Trametes sanguinea]|uniref:Uncharacterized protein n=1 Tax=Trametes sanguinea TaxID=158606 RepID=A0ACC1P9S2_9APHY|nr:hypothetical protein NUW54_g9001 [Trametes sanguinea]
MCAGLDRENNRHGNDTVRYPTVKAIPRGRDLTRHGSRDKVVGFGGTIVDLECDSKGSLITEGVQRRGHKRGHGDVAALVLGVEEEEVVLAEKDS